MLQLKSETETQYHPVFHGILEDQEGGVTIIGADLPTALTTLKKGTPLGEGSTAGQFHVCKTGVVYAASTSTSVKVTKDTHLFVVDDYICNGTKSVKISAINTSEDAYDTLTVGAIVVTEGMVLFQSTSSGTEADDIAMKYTPMGLLRANVDVEDAAADSINITGGLVVRGTVRESLLPYSVADIQKTSLTDRIRFA